MEERDEDSGGGESCKERVMHRRFGCRRREVIWRRRICGGREENGRRREGEEANRREMLGELKFEPNGRKRRVFQVS